MWKRLIALTFTFGLAATAPPVQAQSPCARHDVMAATLEQQYGERLQGQGLQSPVRLYQVWASDETGSWTIVSVHPDGTACVVASGQVWIGFPPLPPGTPS